jgi:Zn-finger nucleic acid-binding protein
MGTMPSAGQLVCPSCGAGVPEGARRCAHCDAPVATVRCASCFRMNAHDCAFCSGCGRDLGLAPTPRDGTLSCPDCHLPLSAFECGSAGLLHDCGGCGGQFVELGALRNLIERHDRLDVGLARARTSPVRAETRVHYVACPVCGSMMNRRNFGGGSGVIVDVCSKHGTWFDSGELPRVLAFVESGGLSRARERDAAEREAAARKEHVRERVGLASTGIGGALGDAAEGSGRSGSLLEDLLMDLFGG